MNGTEAIRGIVLEVLRRMPGPETDDFQKEVDPSGVLCIRTDTVTCRPYDVGAAAAVRLRDVVTLEESPRLGCGLLEIDRSAYPWTLTYDEFYYVVSGVLEIQVDGRSIRGYQGDVMHIPKGTPVRFSSPETVRAVYFTYPADWAQGGNGRQTDGDVLIKQKGRNET